VQGGIADTEFLSVRKKQIGSRHRARRAAAIDDVRACAIFEERRPGDVVGMHVGFDRKA
jgi:hypothetical protein